MRADQRCCGRTMRHAEQPPLFDGAPVTVTLWCEVCGIVREMALTLDVRPLEVARAE